MAKKNVQFVAVAGFEWDGRQYEKGDTFTPPADWERDTAFEEFRNINRARQKMGIPFYYAVKVGEMRNEATNKLEPIMDNRRVVLPLTEGNDKE